MFELIIVFELNALIKFSFNENKKHVGMAVVESALPYCSEVWVMTAHTSRRVKALEMDYLRPTAEETRFQNVTNELKNLRWFQHPLRMPEIRWPKWIFACILPGRRVDWDITGTNAFNKPPNDLYYFHTKSLVLFCTLRCVYSIVNGPCRIYKHAGKCIYKNADNVIEKRSNEVEDKLNCSYFGFYLIFLGVKFCLY